MSSVRNDVFTQFVEGFFEPIAALLQDPSVSEVLINGPLDIFVERSGRLERAKAHFESRVDLMSALRAAAQVLGREFDEQHPILEGRLPDGSRLAAILDPLAEGGPCVAIRRHKIDSLDFGQLIEGGSMTEEAALVLQKLVEARKNILVSGGTGSGKTSVLRCLARAIPTGERIVTIEDARELSLLSPHVVSLEARPADARGKGRVTIRDLFVATLRMRPDRVLIGELRGGEALDLIQAMTSGHGGCLSTIHASSADDALRRLETLALLSGIDLPLVALRAQVASAVDVIIQVERKSSGRRWVRGVWSVNALESDGGYSTTPLFDRAGGEGELMRSGGSSHG